MADDAEAADPPDETDQTPFVRRASPEEVAPRYGVGRLARHVLVCAGPACCDADVGARVWGVFKRRLARLNLTGGDGGPGVFRTRCECLRMCADGPIVVVYPEGAWYRDVTVEAAERIIREHLVGGRVVEDLLFARDTLAGGTLGDDDAS